MKNKFFKVISFMIAICVILSSFYILSYAEESTSKVYSNVLDDLQKASNFNVDDYPYIAGDSSLQLIHLAEGEDKELFVYVYQPGGEVEDLRASSINISTSIRSKNVFYNFVLTYLNSNGVFYKYKVADFLVSNELQRCYEVSSISRVWNADHDEALSNGNTISEIGYPVGRQFIYTTNSDGSNTLTVEDVEYIEITKKYVGYIRYRNQSVSWNTKYTNFDAHFVAIDTNREIDELLEADIYFKQDKYIKRQVPNTSGTSYDTKEEWLDPEEKYVYIDFEDKAYASYGNIFESHEQVWDRIQTTSEFLSQEYENGIFKFPGFKTTSTLEFTGDAYEGLSQTKWVLSFVETESYTTISNVSGIIETLNYHVGDVSVLRLKFITDGNVYDLGVVDNKQSSSEEPSATVDPSFDFDFSIFEFANLENLWESTKKIVSVILFVLLLVIIKPFKLLRKIFNNLSKDTKK